MAFKSITAQILYWSVTFHYIRIHITQSVTLFPDIQTLVGDRVGLPCNITPPSEDDSITLVLWYRSDIKILPIYTVDIRHNREKAKHLSHEVLADRAFFNLSVRPAVLTLDPVLDNDGLEYKCRVDFRWGRTLTSVINLKVIVPPRKIYITDNNNQQLMGLIGPVEEGSDVHLYCIAEGGKPLPSVHWYRDNVLIDSSASIVDDSVVTNELRIENILRSDLNLIYSCRAINNNSSQTTVSTFVTFDIYVKPTDVKIISIRRPLSSGRKFDLICRSYGSRPPAQLTWLKDNRLLSKTRETFAEEGNVTTSILEFVPTAEDHGSYLNCRAENLRLANSTVEDQWILNIFFEPKVNLTMRTNPVKGLVVAGNQVFMECQITANPSVVEVKWLLNGRPLKQDMERDLMIKNTSLEIRNVRREDQGLYKCSASNLEGKTDSNELELDIHFSPICRANQSNNSIGAAIGETVDLECNVEASPASVTFDWTVNRYNLHNHIQHLNHGLTSRLPYRVNNKQDYGIVECSAENVIGRQKQPCTFHIMPAGPPEALFGCLVNNKTDSSIFVECMPGYDGGLNQTFYLDIFDDSERKRLLTQLTNKFKPIFEVKGLQSGHIFHLDIYSTNIKGKSIAQTLSSTTLSLSSLSSDAKEESIQYFTDFSPLFGVIIGFLTATVLITIIIVLICRINRTNNPITDDQKHSPKPDQNFRSKFNNHSIKENNLLEFQDTKSPDIIPPGIEFTEFGHSSTVQCLTMDWRGKTNNGLVSYCNGSISSIPVINYENKKHVLDSNTTSSLRINGKNSNNIDVMYRHDKRSSDYCYNSLPQSSGEILEPVINYSLTNSRNDSRKPTFRALSTPV